MINPNDVYQYAEVIPIVTGQQGSASTTTIGQIFADYEVKEYTDVRNLTSVRSYFVTCKQRIVIPYDGIKTLTNTSVERYENYPIMLIASMKISPSPASCQCVLVDYSPKTVNTSVTTSIANSTTSGASNTTSSEQTSGRSISDTSSFETSSSVGFFGGRTWSQDMGYGSSHTTSSFSSNSTGAAHTADAQVMMSGSNSMSIKDWASYASVLSSVNPRWVWAQEYPWDVLQFHNVTSGLVTLPNYVQGRLVDQTAGQVFPPSQLSLFGVNFLATAKWLVQMPESYSGTDETVSISHAVSVTLASHCAGEQEALESDPDKTYYSAKASLNTLSDFTSSSPVALDLVQLALDPILEEGSNNGAVVGFLLSQFLALPATSTHTFRITSGANNVLVTGVGFASPAGYDAPIVANLSNSVISYKIYFKVVNQITSLSLYVKHWIGNVNCRCLMTIKVNDLGVIYRHIDATENGGGSNNVTTITLRNQDLSSPDFYDYLVAGLNEVSVTITPTDDPTVALADGTYSVRALAVG